MAKYATIDEYIEALTQPLRDVAPESTTSMQNCSPSGSSRLVSSSSPRRRADVSGR